MKWIKDWFSRKLYEGETVDLRQEFTRSANAFNNYVPSVIYGIYRHGSDVKIGECDLRLGMNEELYYAGQIGYRIYENYRGHGYAYDACLILFAIARDEYGMSDLLLTCSPDNIASRKTLEKLGGTLKENVDVPSWHWLYKRGETNKNIYIYSLK